MSVLSTILGQLDRIAAGREAQLAAFGSGTDFWARVDAAADETYENRVKGADMTTLDAELAAGGKWSTAACKKWFELHKAYVSTDLSLTTAPVLGTYLAQYGLRIPFWANEAHYEATNARLAAASVFAKGILVADEADPSGGGLHQFGSYASGALTSVDGALPATVGPAPIMAVNTGSSQSTGAVFTATNYVAATTKDLTLALSNAAQYTQTVLGQQAVSSGASAGQKVVSVAATAQFTVGEYVLIWESDALQEVAVVGSIQSNTSLTMVSNLANSYTTDADVWPLYRSVVYKNGASGSGTVNLYARPDRIIAL